MSADWKSRWLDTARHYSTWSKDPSSKIGAVIVDHLGGRQISMGWNGFPRHFHDDGRLHDREEKYKLVIHAEMNAIFNAAYNGVQLKGSTMLVYGLPICSKCALGICQTGISHLYLCYPESASAKWTEEYELAREILGESNPSLDIEEFSHDGGNAYTSRRYWHGLSGKYLPR